VSTSPVLLTVSGQIPEDIHDQVARGVRPRPDYLVLAEALGADLLDILTAREMGGSIGRLIERVAGSFAMLAWVCFRLRGRYATVFTDGEQVGLPFAALCRVAGRRGSRHIMIGHLLSAPKKVIFIRLLRLRSMIDTVFVYAAAQQQFAEEVLGLPASRVVLTSFMVDTSFFAPVPPATGTPVICSAGLEYRDYPTLIEAVRGLDVEVVLAAASPWSKRADTTQGALLPDNVRVCSLGFSDLRQLYARSKFVVVPLDDVPFQAGVTTILEAMAMGRAVICTRTAGQTDVVIDGETGIYVAPGDVGSLRSAIERLLDNPEEARRMGEAGRRLVRDVDVTRYAACVSESIGCTLDHDVGHGTTEGRSTMHLPRSSP
jgi:glycosyltransferase involved in cell wall biosynthesis